MSSEFERFRKKMMAEHLVKSILVGLTSGLAGAGTAILLLSLLYPALIVGGAITVGVVFAAVGFLLFLRLKAPTERQIAKRLDKEFGLHEKCTTMYDYMLSDNALANKQREDAKAQLSSKPASAVKLRVSAISILALALAAGIFAGSMFTPHMNTIPNMIGQQKSEEPNESDSADDDTGDGQKDESLEDKIQSILDGLQEKLDGERDEGKRSEMGEQAKQEVDKAAQEANEGEADEGQKEANAQAAQEAKDKIDEMVSQEGQQGEGQSGQEGSGSGQQGEGQEEGQEQGEGDEPGEGAGSGQQTERHTDTIYTQDGDTEYGDVIDGYQGDAAEDADQVGDDELTETQGEYFDGLYGQGNQ